MQMELAEAAEEGGPVAGGFAGRLEVLEGPTGRRRWPDDVKARIVAESFQPDVLVSAVAQRHGISPQQLTTWRRAARDGHLALPGEADGPGLCRWWLMGRRSTSRTSGLSRQSRHRRRVP